MARKPEYVKRYENMMKNCPDFYNSDYDEYEALIIKKEQFLKDGDSYRIEYMKNFGELLSKILATKFECIRLKKTITYCMTKINVGESVDMAEMEKEIDGEMKAYFVELKDLVDETNRAKKSMVADEYSFEQSKKIFRRIAKRLHPDINPKTSECEELLDLWNKVMCAYYKFDNEKLEELEIMLNHIIKKYGDEVSANDISDIKNKIKRLEKQIEEILKSQPYTYKDLVSDKTKISQKKEDLRAELEEYQIYQVNLEEKLAELTLDGGGTYTWKMIL